MNTNINKNDVEIFRVSFILFDVINSYGYIRFTLSSLTNSKKKLTIAYSYQNEYFFDKNNDIVMSTEFKPHYSYSKYDTEIDSKVFITKESKKKMEWYLKMVSDLMNYERVDDLTISFDVKHNNKNDEYDLDELEKISIRNENNNMNNNSSDYHTHNSDSFEEYEYEYEDEDEYEYEDEDENDKDNK